MFVGLVGEADYSRHNHLHRILHWLQHIPGQELRHIYFNIVVALLHKNYNHQKKGLFCDRLFQSLTLKLWLPQDQFHFLTHF